MTASSYYPLYYGYTYYSYYGRLNNNRGVSWCTASAARSDEWLEVDLGRTTEIIGVATQGNNNNDDNWPAWVKKFKLSYSSDGNSWTTYSYDGSEMVSPVILVNKLDAFRISITISS